MDTPAEELEAMQRKFPPRVFAGDDEKELPVWHGCSGVGCRQIPNVGGHMAVVSRQAVNDGTGKAERQCTKR